MNKKVVTNRVNKIAKEAQKNLKNFQNIPLTPPSDVMDFIRPLTVGPSKISPIHISKPKKSKHPHPATDRYNHLMDTLIVVGMAGGFTSFGFAIGLWAK